MRPLLAALVVIGFSGCGQDLAGGLESPTGAISVCNGPALATRERLAQNIPLRVHPVTSLGTLTAQRVLNGFTSEVPLKLSDGWFEAQALTSRGGPLIAVMRFGAALDDVKFTALQLPPHGLTLTKVSFAMPEPALMPVRWLGDGSVGMAKGTLAVDLRTSVLLSTGAVSPLEVARLQVPVELTVSQTANRLVALSVQVVPDGKLWNWAGLFELRDLMMSMEAFEVGTPAQLPPGVELN